MNKAILEAITKLNVHKSQGYKWPAPIDGSIGDVFYKGSKILKGNPDNFTYCVGITLQAYLMACEAKGKDLGTASDVMNIRRTWFIAQNVKQPLHANGGALDALSPAHGRAVKLSEAQPGDLVQIWRKSGSGHFVIFINTYTENGYQALKYWSTQPATNGIGYRTEYFEGVQNPIEHIHICRPL